MPGADKTGPGGLGPLTGRGMGNCVGARAGFSGAGPGRGGRGLGRGQGRGGGGRGFGRGFGFRAARGGLPQGYQAGPGLTPEDEAGMLKEEAGALSEELKAVQARLAALETEKNGGK